MRADGSLEAKDAAIGFVIAAVCADGRRVRSEVRFGAEALRALAPFRVTFTDVATRLEWMGGSLERDGEDAFLARCAAALPQEMRAATLAAAAGTIAADRELAPGEVAFLLRAARKLGLDEKETEALLRP